MKILAMRPLADRALTVDLADRAGAAAAARVAGAEALLAAAAAAGQLPGVVEIASSFTSLTVQYDCHDTSQSALAAGIEALLEGAAEAAPAAAGRTWLLPCAYSPDRGLDLADLSVQFGMGLDDLVARHAATVFQVYALGFLPGLPFLGDLPAELALPRRASPRTRVPAGSVAIANRMCVIYPWDSPGGWHIVGRCPVPLFDPRRARPALLSVGDRIRFRPVPEDEADAIASAFAEGRGAPEAFVQGPT